MSYFIFDMDETLAELHTVFYFIASLRVSRELDNDEELTPFLEKQLKKAYKAFVLNVLLEELSPTPLGILRPGILNIMKQLYDLQKQGKIQNVAIYSNNGHLQSLEFIRDLIHRYLKSDSLIKDCIHWDHFMRIEETQDKSNTVTKTWSTLKNILVMGHCQASEGLEQKDVYFFDDQEHIDLHKNLGTNYYKVPPYTFNASFDRIAEIYKKSLKNVDLLEYVHLISDVFDIQQSKSLDDILQEFKKRSGPTHDNLPPGPDRGIDMMLEAIVKLTTSSGGKRLRAKTKKQRTLKKIETKSKRK